MTARVKRDGRFQPIPVLEIAHAEVALCVGGAVPADMRDVGSSELQAKEAVLTGEPTEISKSLEIKDDKAVLPSPIVFITIGILVFRGQGNRFNSTWTFTICHGNVACALHTDGES